MLVRARSAKEHPCTAYQKGEFLEQEDPPAAEAPQTATAPRAPPQDWVACTDGSATPADGSEAAKAGWGVAIFRHGETDEDPTPRVLKVNGPLGRVRRAQRAHPHVRGVSGAIIPGPGEGHREGGRLQSL